MSAPHIEATKHVQNLITKAGESDKASDAMQFSQAALNAANAVRTIVEALSAYPAPQKPE